MKELCRGKPLVAEEMPVAAALLQQQRSRQRWLVPHGFMRWASFGLTVGALVAIPLQLREQRQLIRDYERQGNTDNLGDHRNDVAS